MRGRVGVRVGQKWRARNGGWVSVVDAKDGSRWRMRLLVSGKVHSTSEETLRRYYELLD